VCVQARTVGEALAALGSAHGGVLERVMDPGGELRNFVNVYRGRDNVRSLDGLATPLADNDVLSIVPAVAGGAGKGKDRRLAELRANIRQVTPGEAAQLQRKGAAILDVRESDEIAQGSPVGAHRLGRGFLELRIEEALPELDRTVLVMCATGVRSLFAAEGLQRLGYRDVRNMTGGFTRWKNDGLPFEIPRMLDVEARERYSRHLLMPEVGEAGQLKLLDSRVLLIGAGGLGSPAAYYLAAAGVGTIGIVDDDVVDRTNLQRQILHTDARVGVAKVESARQALEALNPSVQVTAHRLRLDSSNVEGIFDGYDIVIDGSDNFPTRYLVNDACVKLGIPNVHGAVYRFEGQVAVFWPTYAKRRGPCYRCLYPEPPPPELAPSCAEAGVLGVLPGVVGLLEAVEGIKILLDIGEPLVGRMLYYDALRASFTELKLDPDPACRYCGEGAAFPGYVDYEKLCSVSNG
jgi:molybdopterin/thiamine biosynthesis adenylyltransferase/rhodanese-related sulfurtransferase/molybdopterin converting factor small subunit